VLLRRWENALEDVSMWRFNPTVVHGDLHEDNLLVDDGRVTAVTGWTDLRVGDPADDLAWLVASNEPEFVDAVVGAYHEARKEPVDPHLLRRAALAAEFALAQYLVKALALHDAVAAADGEDMLRQLAADIEEQEAEDHAASEAAAPTGAPKATFPAAEPEAVTSAVPIIQAPSDRPSVEPSERPSVEPSDRETDPEPPTDAIPLVHSGDDLVHSGDDSGERPDDIEAADAEREIRSEPTR
jgi:hypothetical protein